MLSLLLLCCATEIEICRTSKKPIGFYSRMFIEYKKNLFILCVSEMMMVSFNETVSYSHAGLERFIAVHLHTT